VTLTFDDLKKLQQKKYREKFGYFVAEGEHLVQELERACINNPALLQSQLYVTADSPFSRTFATTVISPTQMARVCATKTPQGIFALVPIAALSTHVGVPRKERVMYLHEVQDPGNLGTILRSLAWFGAGRCLLSPGSVDPFNPKVVRASMGAIFHVPIETEFPLATLGSRYPRVAALDMTGVDIADSRFGQADVFVFGNEARGLPREMLEDLQADIFTIPGGATVESLNLGTVVSICAYALNAQALP